MMDRLQIKDMRFGVEGQGYFVEQVKDDYIIVSNLDDPDEGMFLVYPEEKCPICGEYLVFSTEADRYMCSGRECLYLDTISAYPKQLPAEEKKENKKYMEMKFWFNEDDQIYANAFMEDIGKLVFEWYKEVIEISFFEDEAMNESTLGLVDDDEE